MTRVMVVGAKGRVGQCVLAGVEIADDLDVAGAVEIGDDLDDALRTHHPDVAVDFTTPDVVFENVSTVLRAGVHAVVGTTGMDQERLDALDVIAREHKVACLVAPNFAIGAVLMMRFAQEAAAHFQWTEVVERHHENKLDAPSGTARLTAERIAAVRAAAPQVPGEKESASGARGGEVAGVRVHAIRLPGSVAHQEVWFGGPGETLVIRHDTINREVFVPGVLLAVRAVTGREGLIHGLEPVLWPDA